MKMTWKQCALSCTLVLLVGFGFFVALVLYQTRDSALPHFSGGYWLPAKDYESILEQRYYCNKNGRQVGSVWLKSSDWQADTNLDYEDMERASHFEGNVNSMFDTVDHAKEAVEKYIQREEVCK